MNGGLGVRKLDLVNRACIMKIGWMLKTQRNYLWVEVLKGKYGRGMDWKRDITVKKGDSNLWRAIGDVWENLSEHQGWIPNNGNTIYIWTDNWIKNGLPWNRENEWTVPIEIINDNLCDYVTEHRGWDLEKIYRVASKQIGDLFLTIMPPIDQEADDEIFWTGSTNGIFSIKSAYYNLAKSLWQPRDSVWKHIWNLNCPERVKTFIWRATHDALPTRTRITQWSNGNSYCPWCVDKHETVLHALRDCNRAEEIWMTFVECNKFAEFFSGNLREWINSNLTVPFGRQNGKWKDFWALTCWIIWQWWNEGIFDPGYIRPRNVRISIRKAVESLFRPSEDNKGKSRRTKDIQLWQKPEENCYKINTDGAFNEALLKAGSGVVIRDSEGEWIMGATRNIGRSTALSAELWGIHDGLCLAKDLGLERVILESDSLFLISKLQKKEAIEGNLKPLFRNIIKLLESNWNIRIYHV